MKAPETTEWTMCQVCCTVDMPTAIEIAEHRKAYICVHVLCVYSSHIFVYLCLHLSTCLKFFTISLQPSENLLYTHLIYVSIHIFWIILSCCCSFYTICETRHRCFSLFSPLFACGVIFNIVYVCIRLSSYHTSTPHTISNQILTNTRRKIKEKKKENFVWTETECGAPQKQFPI